MTKKLKKIDFSIETTTDIKVDEAKNDKSVLLCSNEFQLMIYEPKIINILPTANLVVVENLGGGDVYVDKDHKRFDADSCLAPHEKREIIDAEKLVVCSASRPTVRISQYS